jgi:hypothetical protein
VPGCFTLINSNVEAHRVTPIVCMNAGISFNPVCCVSFQHYWWSTKPCTTSRVCVQWLNEHLLDSPAWDILVGHFLGMDHAGHTYGVSSPQMLAKVQANDRELVHVRTSPHRQLPAASAVQHSLICSAVAFTHSTQSSAVYKARLQTNSPLDAARLCCLQIIDAAVQLAGPGQLHGRTLLLVFGDHGQTMTGDHGGGSPEELDSALVAVNLGAVASHRTAAAIHSDDVSSVADQGSSVREAARTYGAAVESNCGCAQAAQLAQVPQLDFAASLAALLGLPIPAENVGADLHVQAACKPQQQCWACTIVFLDFAWTILDCNANRA